MGSAGGGVAELPFAFRFFADLLSRTGVELVTDKAFAEDILAIGRVTSRRRFVSLDKV